jgi:5-methylcytosine-specific restriction protein B
MSDKNYWFVGASFGDEGGDQTARFLRDDIWENGYDDKYLEDVRSIKVGETIAIKSSYTRKNGLPFEANKKTVSVMGIKAVGIVVKNHGDGRFLDVEWKQRFEIPREWYFFTSRTTIWRVKAEDWMRSGLLDFLIKDIPQDYDKFRNAPYWADRYGQKSDENLRFQWTSFYEEMASALLKYKDNRRPLVDIVYEMLNSIEGLNTPTDKYKDGTKGPLKDICPFTIIGIFNRNLTDLNRIDIARKLSVFLEITTPVPISFEGVPVLNNLKSWFFAYENDRNDDDIDSLWNFFDTAINYADNETVSRDKFMDEYDLVSKVKNVKWNLTMGLFWIRPWSYLTLDKNSRGYIDKNLNLDISSAGINTPCNSKEYLALMEKLNFNFAIDNYACHSFPELSLNSWHVEPVADNSNWRNVLLNCIHQLCVDTKNSEFTKKEFLERYQEELEDSFPNNDSITHTISNRFQLLRDDDILEFDDFIRGKYRYLLQFSNGIEDTKGIYERKVTYTKYDVTDVRNEGCFIDEDTLNKYVSIFKKKKNLILQGPPGTGKTWLAKRLGYCVIGSSNEQALKAVQFHPNISYEDFVRGWRPSGDGKLALVDGPFLELVHKANNDKETNYVIVIEEVNRGNPAQIFGELLTLLEADKRTPKEALELCYRKVDGERIHVPPNLYVIGTMNVADRSLAMVDYALRRRFAFINLQPAYNEDWISYVKKESNDNLTSADLTALAVRINALNLEIAKDPSLGRQFSIGHSYFTPSSGSNITDFKEWVNQIVDTEIEPLLEEYWFEDAEKVRTLCDDLKG